MEEVLAVTDALAGKRDWNQSCFLPFCFICSPPSFLGATEVSQHQKNRRMKKMKKQSQEKKNRRKKATLEMALPNLPNEIIDRIFLNVPTKNLLEFRCVIRDYSRFHSPNFIKMHLNRLMEIDNSSTFIITTASKTYKFDFEALAKPIELKFSLRDSTYTTPIELAASCNGFLCLTHRMRYGNIVYLWNPVTAEYKQLPAHNLKPWSIFCLGFGYDPISGKFKVIAIAHLRDPKTGYKTVAFVYTLGTSSWRSLGEYFPHSFSSSRPRTQVFEGCPHWIDYQLKASLISFNIGDEKFKQIPMPPFKNGHTTNIYLNAFGGRLSVFGSELKHHELWVWMDDRFEGTWIKQLSFYNLDIGFGPSNYPKPWGFKNGQVLLEDNSWQPKYMGPILLDTRTNDITALHLRGEPWSVYSYTESLAMLTLEDGGDVHQNPQNGVNSYRPGGDFL